MSFIKPRTRGEQFMPHRTRLDRENHEALHAYAAFLSEEPEYALNELINTVLADQHGVSEGQGLREVARGASAIVCATALVASEGSTGRQAP